MFWTELNTPCNLGDNPESPDEGKLREGSFPQSLGVSVVRGNSSIPPSGLMFPSPKPLHISSLMQTKSYFQYLYGPCCWEMGSLFWWKFLALLENGASWNIHPLCVQQSCIFHFLSENPLGYGECCRNPHTHANAGWRRTGSCRLELQIWGQGTKLDASEHEVHLLQVSVRSPYLNSVTLHSNNRCALCRQGCASSTRPFIRELLFLVQAHGFPIVSMKTTLFWKKLLE